MRKRLLTFHTISLLACIFWLTSCSTQAPATPESNINLTSTSTIQDTSGTETSTPTSTKEPTRTAAPTPTPTKWPSQQITSDNAGSLREINSWGQGSVMQIQKLDHKQGEYLVLTPPGLYWYGSTSPFLLAFIPEVDDFVLSPDGRWLPARRTVMLSSGIRTQSPWNSQFLIPSRMRLSKELKTRSFFRFLKAA